ncbi:MAG: histidine--tRNA ligase [Patescibacteria group bacterium]|nr:histidine--tRNA ligase [Patescibacteria group bacterium]
MPNKKKKNKITIQTPKGLHDILPEDRLWWDKILKVFGDLKDIYSFDLIETPVLEYANLFEKALGKETDLMSKEMYSFKTKGGESLVLRPEGTIATARAYIQNNLSHKGQPQRLCYYEPMFRHENPQAGRYREHRQIGFEILGGANDPVYDAEVIQVIYRLLQELKLKNLVLKINSIGCRNCRPAYERKLKSYYSKYEKDLCYDCKKRLSTNPLRLLDCKNETCQPFKAGAPNILDKFCGTCSSHFKGVLEYLEELGVEYTLDNTLVRGLDYYDRTVFEIYTTTNANAEGKSEINKMSLAGGGRYDYLIEKIGGKPTPAIGGAIGVERVIEAMKAQEVIPEPKEPKKVFFIHIGEVAKKKSLKIIEELRKKKISVFEDLGRESLKAQLKLANKRGISLVLILGQKEVYEESIIIRNLKTSIQENIPLSRLTDSIKKYL